jgi:DNA polymerase V
MAKLIGLADCNNFYVSCERVFNPRVRNKPVLVLSNNDGNAIARSQEAKDLGVKMGHSIFKIKDLIWRKNIHLFSSNYTLYADISERVVQAIREFAPRVEVYSIDEVFIDLDHVPEEEMETFLHKMRESVKKWTGIPISIGVSSSKTLAKVANKMAKNSGGVCFLSKGLRGIEKIGIGEVWGIGVRSEKKLKEIGCHDVGSFVNLPSEWVRKNMTINGLKTQQELKGVQCIQLSLSFKPRKNISTSRSFGKSTSDFLEVQKATHLYTLKSVEKLKSEGLSAGYVIVHLSNDRYKEDVYYSRNFGFKLLRRTDNFEEIWGQVQNILIQEFSEDIRYRKSGVSLGDLQPKGSEQTSLFSETIKPLEIEEPEGTNWVMRRNHLSKRYTTSWEEIPTVDKILFH